MNDFINSIKKRDPAANSTLSVILTYPGVKAVFFYRIANFFHLAGFHLLARIWLAGLHSARRESVLCPSGPLCSRLGPGFNYGLNVFFFK